MISIIGYFIKQINKFDRVRGEKPDFNLYEKAARKSSINKSSCLSLHHKLSLIFLHRYDNVSKMSMLSKYRRLYSIDYIHSTCYLEQKLPAAFNVPPCGFLHSISPRKRTVQSSWYFTPYFLRRTHFQTVTHGPLPVVKRDELESATPLFFSKRHNRRKVTRRPGSLSKKFLLLADACAEHLMRVSSGHGSV